MTAKQINNIKTVNHKNVLDLQMVLFNAFEITTRLQAVTNGAGENVELLNNIRFGIMQAIADAQTIVKEK